MNMNSQEIKGKWTEIKGEIQKSWGKLTHDELEKTKGDFGAIKGLIGQKYGKALDDSQDKLKSIFDRFAEKKDEVTEGIKEKLKQ
jgi:uncharacterized protein YjbJ (UPF0337 family)